MYLYRDEIISEIETSDNEHRSYDSKKDQIVRYEHIAEDAPPIDNDFKTEDAPTMDAATTRKKRKGGSSTKNLKVTEPMHSEYNSLGQPCRKWRRQYGKKVYLRIRKISILHKFDFMRFKTFLALLRIKSLKFGLFCTKFGIQHYLVYIIALKWL